ncbi:cyclic nucleotide-binding domain-containing protein, partial [Pseudomonadota bacterium]
MNLTHVSQQKTKEGIDNFPNEVAISGLDLPPYAQLTQESSLFYAIPLKKNIGKGIQRKHYSLGTILFEQNSLGRVFYLILSGKVEVSQEIGKQRETIRYLGPGQYFGDHALIHHEPHRHTVTSATPLTVLTITANEFMAMYHAHQKLRDRLETLSAIYQIPGKGLATLHLD